MGTNSKALRNSKVDKNGMVESPAPRFWAETEPICTSFIGTFEGSRECRAGDSTQLKQFAVWTAPINRFRQCHLEESTAFAHSKHFSLTLTLTHNTRFSLLSAQQFHLFHLGAPRPSYPWTTTSPVIWEKTLNARSALTLATWVLVLFVSSSVYRKQESTCQPRRC